MGPSVRTDEYLEEELPGLHEDLVVLHEQGEERVVVPVGRQDRRLLRDFQPNNCQTASPSHVKVVESNLKLISQVYNSIYLNLTLT